MFHTYWKSKIVGVAVLVIAGSGCAGRTVNNTENSNSYGDAAVSQKTTETQAEAKPDEQKSENSPQKSPPVGNVEASADYHFSMAQAYVAEGNPDRAIEEFKLVLVYDPNSALVYARIATEYIKKGQLTLALEACKEAVTRDSKFTDARLMLAGLYSSTRDNKAALAEYDRILKVEPAHEEANIYKAQLLLEDGQPAPALAQLRGFLKKNPDSLMGWYYLGRAEQKLEHNKEAIAAYKKALAIRPGFTQAALAMGYIYELDKNNAAAISVYKDLYDQSQDLGAANRIATLYLKEEKYKEATPYLEAIRNSDGEDMNVRVKLGLVQMETKQYDQAIKTFKEILEKNPDSDRVHYYLGSLYEETKRSDLAISELKKIDPNSKLYPDAILHVAYLVKQTQGTKESRKFIRGEIEKQPRNAGFYLFHASLDEELKDTDSAVAILESGMKQFPEDEKIHYYLGNLYERQGKTDRAIAQMETILKTNPDNVDALNYIGYTWTMQGMRLHDAEKLLKRAMVLKPNNGYITDSWGWHLFVTGRVKEAVVELEKAAKLKPQEATILEHLADAYMKCNLREKALAQYEAAARYADEDDIKTKIVAKLQTLKTEMARGQSSAERVPASKASPATN